MTQTLFSSHTMRRAGIVLAAMSLPLLAACSSDSVEDSSAEFCNDLTTLEAEVTSMKSLVASNATLEQIQDQEDVVADAWSDVRDSAENLNSAVSDDAESAADDFQSALGDIPGDATLTEAAPQYDAAVEAYLQSLAGISSEADCA